MQKSVEDLSGDTKRMNECLYKSKGPRWHMSLQSRWFTLQHTQMQILRSITLPKWMACLCETEDWIWLIVHLITFSLKPVNFFLTFTQWEWVNVWPVIWFPRLFQRIKKSHCLHKNLKALYVTRAESVLSLCLWGGLHGHVVKLCIMFASFGLLVGEIRHTAFSHLYPSPSNVPKVQ